MSRLALCLLGLLGTAQGNALADSPISIADFRESSDSFVSHAGYQLRVPQGGYRITIYSDGKRPVFHLQSKSVDEPDEWLIDGMTGQQWTGNLGDLLAGYRRLETIDPKSRLPDGADETLGEHLKQAGCFNHNWLCTTLADADFVVFASHNDEFSEFSFELHDYSRGFTHIQNVFSGTADFDSNFTWTSDVVSAMAYSGRFSWREKFIDALRSIREVEELKRIAGNLGQHPEIARLPFVGADSAVSRQAGKVVETRYNRVNLKREFEISACRLRAGLAARAPAAAQGGDLEGAVSECADYATFVSAAFMDAAGPESDKLANEMRRLATSAGSKGTLAQDLRAHACWLDGKGCLAQVSAPRLANKRISSKTQPTTPKAPKSASAPPVPPIEQPSGSATGTSSGGGSAPEEWAQISKLNNKLLLVGFDEVGVGLTRDAGDLGGLIFVARPVEGAKDGRFIVETFQNPRSPVRLAQGDYRVRAKLSVDFQREDRCTNGVVCLLKRPIPHSKTVPFETTFYIGRVNGWRDKRTVSVGSLVPLVADSSARYTSSLKEVRLAVQNVSFEVN